jgi:hypothetical protein
MSITKTKGYQFLPAQGYMGDKPAKDTYRYMIIDDQVEEVREIVVHEFMMGDVDDPDLYAGEPLWKWQQSEIGQWVMEHAVETPFWHRIVDPTSFGYKYCVVARLKEQDQTYWALKWQKS